MNARKYWSYTTFVAHFQSWWPLVTQSRTSFGDRLCTMVVKVVAESASICEYEISFNAPRKEHTHTWLPFECVKGLLS